MEMRVLGGIEFLDPEPIALGGPTQRRMLGMLLVNAGEALSIDQLVDGIWPNGDTPENAEQNVRKYVHRLRNTLGEFAERIETVGTGYRLHLEPDELDALRFEGLVAAARAASSDGETRRAVELLDQALALWRGQPYDEVADLDWARAEVARLGELHVSAIERRFAALLDSGRHTEIIGPLREIVGEEPWREPLRGQLALALYRAGRQAEALRVISEFRSELVEELGIDPSPDLDALEHRILEHDPSLLPTSHQQHMLRGYQLDEVIGEGAFSLVWRGVQPSLGRTVAVKQIRAELANQSDFVRRFETEAQTVAALEHPYIVPLYDYWREPDSAFLVMRYVAGGTLESEILDHGLDESRLRRLVDQVGSALHTAHRAGVVHRDMKSANVLIDADDNFYLTDFGIALTGSADDDELATSLSTGSPAYASPEQLRRQGLDARTDVYGFGITLFEAATGRLPFVDAPTKAALVKRQLEDPVPAPSSVTPTVPAWVDEVVGKATAKNPADRFGSMEELLGAVSSHGAGVVDRGRGFAASTVIGDLVNPFKALRAFREADSDDFYGRDRLVARFVDVLGRPGSAGRLLAAVGPSGSGKSSAVRSGLLPRLRDGAVSGSRRWFITTMLPGTHPFEELESALSRVAVRQPGPLVEMMRGDDRGIARAINQVLPDEETELLVVIDQFEELFTHSDPAERTRFLDGLLAAVREPRSRLRLVVTIRADFLDGPLRHPGLAARLETATVTVSPLAADELEAAIVEPVRRQGAAYEPGLVARIMADVGDQPGALPLLQYALTELFDAHVSGLLRAESYDAIGGLTGALASRAEATLTGMTPEQQGVTRRLFGRLVTLGEGTEDTRRRARRSELGDDHDTTSVIETFGAARLLVFDHDPSTREPTVEIAHEALLNAWPRLRGWLDEDRDGLRVHRHLTDTSTAWLASGRDEGELYRGGRLETATTWVSEHITDLNEAEQEFFDASVASQEAEVVAERRRFDQQVRDNRRLKVLVSVATVIAVIAAVAGVFALQQRSRADDEAADAERNAELAEEKAEEAEANLELAEARADEVREALDTATEANKEAGREAGRANAATNEANARATEADIGRVRATAFEVVDRDLRLGLLLATEAYRIEPSRENEGALSRLLSDTGGVTGTIPSPGLGQLWIADDGVTAVARSARAIDVWDLATAEHIRTLDQTDVFGRVDVSFVAGLAAVTDNDGTVLVDIDGNMTTELSPNRAEALAFSPVDGSLAVAFADRIEVWSVSTRSEPELLSERPLAAQQIVWHPDGNGWVLAIDGRLEFWELDGSSPRWSIPDVPSRVGNAQPLVTLFSSDGERLVYATQPGNLQGVVRAVSMADGSLVGREASAADSFIVDLFWLDEEAVELVAARVSNDLRGFDLSRGVDFDPPFESQGTWDIEYSWSLDRIITAGNNGFALHSKSGGPIERRVPLRPEQTLDIGTDASPFFALVQDGTSVLMSVPQWPDWAPVVEYDLTTDALVPTTTDLEGIVYGANGHVLLVNDTMVMLDEDLEGRGESVPTPPDAREFVPSPDGRFFAAAYPDENRAELYRSTGELVSRDITVPGGESSRGVAVSFSADGTRLATYQGSGTLAWAIWDTATGSVIHEGDSDDFVRPVWSGSRLYVERVTRDFVQVQIDPVTFQPVGEPLIGHTGNRCAIVEDLAGDLIATQANDGTVRVWDQQTGKQFGAPIPTPACAVQWADDGKLMATAHPGFVSIWNFDTASWPGIACDIAGRNTTKDEWDEFGPRTIDYRATCPRWDS